MARLLITLLTVLMVMAAIKLAIIAIVIAGLIFRTKQTIGLLLLGGVMTFVSKQPLMALGIASALIFVAILRKSKRAEDDPPPLLAGPDKAGST